ncbi:MAG: N-formylglutamate amidohydrolase [Rhizobiaceae bacterium]|nr:N-formylglutamate amidohydrolase [Rhizobiaceae bacterium]
MEKTVEHSSEAELPGQGIDPEPIELMNEGSASPLLLVCEHAGQAIPHELGDLGLSDDQRRLHIAYDIGAAAVARDLARRFGCALILQRYSRLVIDCNRPVGTPQSIPEISDSIRIPGNAGLSDRAREQRANAIFDPYAALCASQIAQRHIEFTYSIHSFTPQMDGLYRPWDIAFLYRDNCSQGEQLAGLCHEMFPQLKIGKNEPYSIEDPTDWYIPVCAEPRKIPHCLIEIRNDHIDTNEGSAVWAERLYQLISCFMEQHNATDS